MIRYFTSRGLSQVFGIKLARWKRWCREFLPPDPLGGMQSGYARQYSLDEAFVVYLGGHLVNHLHFSIPDARVILNALDDWLKENGFLGSFDSNASRNSLKQHHSPQFEILIFRKNPNGIPACCIREVVSPPVEGKNEVGMGTAYHTRMIPPDLDVTIFEQALSAKVLFITKLLFEFVGRLEIDPAITPFPQ